MNEGIIDKMNSLAKDMLDKVLKRYGIEATIEILELEKKLEKIKIYFSFFFVLRALKKINYLSK